MVPALYFDVLAPIGEAIRRTRVTIIDRNPQTFVKNIFEAKESDFKAATHRVYRTAQYPSRVDIPVVRAQ